MEDLIRTALAAVGPAEVVHADVRVVAPDRFVQLAVRNGAASALTDSRTEAIGVRVRTDRAWGFATTCDLRPEPVREVARLAVRLARAAGRHARTPLRVTDEAAPTGGQYHTPLRRDPFSTSFESVVELLTAAEKGLHVARAVRSGIATFQAWEENKWYGSSDGASFTSRIVHVGAGLTATAVRGLNVQRRSTPSSHGGDFAQAGFEFVEGLDLVTKAPGDRKGGRGAPRCSRLPHRAHDPGLGLRPARAPGPRKRGACGRARPDLRLRSRVRGDQLGRPRQGGDVALR